MNELRKIPDNQAKKGLILGITSKLKLLVMDTRTHKFVELPPGEIQQIFSKHPNSATVIVESAPMINGYYQGDHHLQNITYRDLWFYDSDYYVFSGAEQPFTSEILENNEYWNHLRQLAIAAIEKFKPWLEKQHKIQLSGNVKDWIEHVITTDTREIHFIKKILKHEFDL
ncbi:TPA: hypothetical protein JBI33_13730 [Legionella pneumophila]|nr:hypothetical protein [Legionella pneumophila]HAU1284671.1 hypothetical protein [Legionella pneumophila]